MHRIYLLCFVLWSAVSFGGVDEQFSAGALGIEWGSTLEDVQAVYPDGTAWESNFGDNPAATYYALSGDFPVLGLDIPAHLVHFIFTEEYRLQGVYFHFKYSDRETALYGIAEILGQDFSVKDEAGTRQFIWSTGRTSFAKLNVGNSPQRPWVHLAVRPRADPATRRK